MRKTSRHALPARVAAFLNRKQSELNANQALDARRIWDRARRTRSVAAGAVGVLRSMAGKRCRCMYCGDSEGTDVEHYYPISRFRNLAFMWENMLLACAKCNRLKSEQLPGPTVGDRRLIDPTLDSPWDHLYYDDVTGMLSPRVRREDGLRDAMGEYTTRPTLLPLNDEIVTEGRCRCSRAMKQVAASVLTGNPGGGLLRQDALDRLGENLLAACGYGLGSWYLRYEGRTVPPFDQLVPRLGPAVADLISAIER